MAQIVINEISQNYTYNIGTSTFATVALPITASWGPAFTNPDDTGVTEDEMLESTTWRRFTATQAGLESFVSTYRGPAANYRVAKDYSYHMAMTLLTSGYDVLVCRLCPGTVAKAKELAPSKGSFSIQAKYPGTFGNSLLAVLKKVPRYNPETNKYDTYYWNLIVYVVDASGVKTAVENMVFVFDINNSTDTMLHISEIESQFVTLYASGLDDTADMTITGSTAEKYKDTCTIEFTGGADRFNDQVDEDDIVSLSKLRYNEDTELGAYTSALTKAFNSEGADKGTLYYKEWLYTNATKVYDLLKDKLSYNPQRIISPGWDDQDILGLNSFAPEADITLTEYPIQQVSPLHAKLMDVAYYSRCATALIDIPKSLPRSKVHNESTETENTGYAQRLARYLPSNTAMDVNGSLYHTHSALFAPWGQYTYVGTSKQNAASPSFLALVIQRAMLLNQTLQYEWALPTTRNHKLPIGKADYTIPKKVLDEWQSLEGVGVNAITTIPGIGNTIWGNSTLYEVPPATYQALANLSTRYLVNAVEDIAYRCGLSITFQYNNDQAYSKFYAGVTPTLDTMKNVGAIDDYYVRMAADINGLDQVNANTVVGKIYLVINGVINDIVIDMIALPPGADLDQYRS